MPDQSYSERVRHPSGALDPPKEKSEGQNWDRWLLIVLVVAVLIVAWRVGWLDKIIAPAKAVVNAVTPVANPHGWV